MSVQAGDVLANAACVTTKNRSAGLEAARDDRRLLALSPGEGQVQGVQEPQDQNSTGSARCSMVNFLLLARITLA